VAGKIRSIKKSNDIIGNRTRDFSVRSKVPQPITLPRGFHSESNTKYKWNTRKHNSDI
jgi:hypothetical protein